MAQSQVTQRNKPLSKAVKRYKLGGPTSGAWLRNNACTPERVGIDQGRLFAVVDFTRSLPIGA